MTVLVVLFPVLVVVALLVAVLLRPSPLQVSERLGVVAHSTRRWRLAGMLVGLVAAVTTALGGALGRGLMLAVPLFGLCALLGVIAGERGVRAPAGARRSVTLEVRSPRDYLPLILSSAVGVATVALGALLVFTSATGSADDLGRAGRALNRACSATSAQGRGPWPGIFYAWPLAAVVVIGLAVAAIALGSVTSRPRQAEDLAVDDALRRQAATGVIAAVGLLVTVPLAAVSVVAAPGLLQICAAPAAWTVIGVVLLAVAPLALALGCWCAVVLIGSGRVNTAEPARS